MSLMTKRELFNWFEEWFPNCGCGAPTETRLFIAEVIEAFGVDRGQSFEERMAAVKKLLPGVYESGQNNYAEWALLYAIDATGILEHGTSVRCSWPTDYRVGASIKHYRETGQLEAMFRVYQAWSVDGECTPQNWTPMSYEDDSELTGWDDVPVAAERSA